ncbi:hypothetical protein [Sporosarcina limicola]|uniref:Uncharacterized protein n=1 Tax=Sporosarcina limicola TaxID=34101 RepID=A0A927R572_9BACL|nr:hypothetical protein [Sporosarcina limicola]MBE1553619.1 hypothetical protein [Sporosarcina limicola]
MGKKKVFYLDPDEREWTLKDLGLNWEAIERLGTERKGIEGTFLVDKGRIRRWSELTSNCKVCLGSLAYNDEHDSIYCPTCDEWRESSCNDPNCEYCLARPTKPSQCM